MKRFFNPDWPTRILLVVVTLSFPLSPSGFAQDAPDLEPLSDADQALAKQLQAQLSSDSEAGLMLAAILEGRSMGPNDGWFSVAQGQTRYSWQVLAEEYDYDQDHRISAPEFPGTAEDFRRLDRNRDQAITAEDLEWETTRGSSDYRRLWRLLDRDFDGELTRDEWDAAQGLLLQGRDSISAEALREAWFPPDAAESGPSERPSRSTLLQGLAKQEIGSFAPGPALNEPAPDFELATVDGRTLQLSQYVGSKPVVLIFGNYTCGPFRGQAGNLKSLYERYRDRAHFLMVYVREAHPEDGWHMSFNEGLGVRFTQPTTDAERQQLAARCESHLDFDIPVLVDTIDDSVGHAYSGGPARLYLIDTQGQVAFKSGRGPHYFFPSQMESALIWLLSQR